MWRTKYSKTDLVRKVPRDILSNLLLRLEGPFNYIFSSKGWFPRPFTWVSFLPGSGLFLRGACHPNTHLVTGLLLSGKSKKGSNPILKGSLGLFPSVCFWLYGQALSSCGWDPVSSLFIAVCLCLCPLSFQATRVTCNKGRLFICRTTCCISDYLYMLGKSPLNFAH